ncbi:MAG TPA: SH3 domain-containing protein, partial [Bacilli bacterium]|nr:SH3 domain-containing protein [Bacilli bacterium]
MKRILKLCLICLIGFVLPLIANAESTPAKITAIGLNVRTGPGTSYSAITSLIYGTDITIIERSGSWYKIIYDGAAQGWVSGTYVDILSDITYTDEAYCNSLVTAGFNSTYCPYLSKIHQLHPNWTFTPLVTNLKWSDVVNGEDGKNVINSSNPAYQIAAHQENGWYVVNQNVNAYFLDPRNFLTESSVFMFENLGYNSSYQTSAVVKSIFPTTSYLYDDTYIGYFMQAANDYNVSPIHLATRVRQEGGSNASYGPVSGNFSSTNNVYYNGISLDGYYNYYNINAYYQNGYTPQTMGLAFACGPTCGFLSSYNRPWTSRELAIKGGAQWIANGYINKGQNTLYLQKFNTNPNSTSALYTHQYMTNISAPLTEGAEMYDSYKEMSLLDMSFNFYIPVYKEMPTRTVQPSTLSNNSYLNSLMVNGNLLNGFDEDILDYTYYIISGTTSVNVSAVAAHSNATITGTGTIALDSDSKQVTVVVTAQNGSTRTYNVTIKRVTDNSTVNDIISKISVRLSGLSLGGFGVGSTITNLINMIQSTSPSANIVVKNANGTVKSSGKLFTGDTLTLKTLTNDEQTRGIAVIADASGDGDVTILDLLKDNCSIKDVLVEVPGGIKILPASSGIFSIVNLTDEENLKLLNNFESLNELFDYIIIDTAAGIGKDVLFFNSISHFVTIIVTPEPTSI